MATGTTPGMDEVKEAREMVERAMKLSPAVRERVGLELLWSVDPPPGRPASDREYWKAELARRIAEAESGSVPMLTREEAVAQVREAMRKLGVEL